MAFAVLITVKDAEIKLFQFSAKRPRSAVEMGHAADSNSDDE